MKIPFAKPEITEQDIMDVTCFLSSCDGQLTQGKKVKQFEQKFSRYISSNRGDKYGYSFEIDLKKEIFKMQYGNYCLATSSCMSALHLAYLALGIGPGDEVICPAMSHVATAHAIELVGAKPVFIDCSSDGNIDGNLIRNELFKNDKIKAISLVHYLGNPCGMEYIMHTAKDFNIPVIEDCALSLGSRLDGIHTGLFGTCGAFSFYPTKHLPIGEGGMFVTKDYELYRKAKKITSFGKTEGTHADYDIGLLGGNFRMSEVQAVMGLSQLKRLSKNLEIRKKNLDRLKKEFNVTANIINVPKRIRITGGTYCAILRCKSKDKRNVTRNSLKLCDIQTSIYYPHPIPRLKHYRKKYGYAPIRYPEAIKIADTTIALPIGPHIIEEMMDYMIECLKEII